jgi:predicted aspartyl protease
LSARKAALAALHVRSPKTLEVRGALLGSGMNGTFHSWQTGDRARSDEHIGGRAEESLRLGDDQYLVNESGNVRRLQGLMLQRQRTSDFIDDDGFVREPQYDTFVGVKQLPDGRSAYELTVAPPNGQTETIDLDTKTLMIDRISYDEVDGTSTEDFYDYKTFAGALLAQKEVDSNGDHSYDITRYAEIIDVDRPIANSVFTIPQNTVIQTDKPVTVPLIDRQGHYYVHVRIGTRDYIFLVDTGAQSVVLDSRVAAEQGLKPIGHLEVSGAQRIGGMGIAKLDSLQIGGVDLPVGIVSVLNLQGATGSYDADGVLGYPFFASAEVTIDTAAGTLTFAKPGTMHTKADAIPVDVDRQLVEIQGKVNGVSGRFVVDTGNSTELLLFAPFMHAHQYLVQFQQRQFANDYGVGGSVPAASAIIDELDIGGYRLFNRYTNLMLADRGAFADRFDAGNIGIGILKNFIVTYDIANNKMYLQRGSGFDDGRYRARYDHW